MESGLPLGVARYFPVDFVSVGDTEKPRIERIHRRVEYFGHFRDVVYVSMDRQEAPALRHCFFLLVSAPCPAASASVPFHRHASHCLPAGRRLDLRLPTVSTFLLTLSRQILQIE